MEQRYGFIRDKYSIKVLVLYVLCRLPEPVSPVTLSDIIIPCDDGINYFDLVECIADLIKTEHIQDTNGDLSITAKGRANASITESDLPYSVRMKAEKAASSLAEIQQRNSLITATHGSRGPGGYTVNLSLSDGIGQVFSIDMLAVTQKQAAMIENNFKKNAEAIYSKIIELLEN